MTQQHLRSIAIAHPVPSEHKVELRLASLERMKRFYEERIAVSTAIQSRMFREFIVAIVYAITIIKMYRKLTKRLAAELQDDSTNT